MSFKQSSVSMPMASAGIVGLSHDTKISGIEIEPKLLIVAAVVIVIVIKVAGIVVSF
jgi:preprotein translocase subunit Sec61beta